MPGQLLLTLLLLALLAGAALVTTAILRHTPRSGAADALNAGAFEEAQERAETGPEAGREDLWVAAVAAKHRLDLRRAAGYLDRLLAAEPDDGDARLERGLVASYAGEQALAASCFDRVSASRADLAEPLALHRAWAALDHGEREHALRLFEEIEVPLSTKLEQDLGPGEALFAEWFLQAAALWQARGDHDRARWAARLGLEAAPESRLGERIGPFADPDGAAPPTGPAV